MLQKHFANLHSEYQQRPFSGKCPSCEQSRIELMTIPWFDSEKAHVGIVPNYATYATKANREKNDFAKTTTQP